MSLLGHIFGRRVIALLFICVLACTSLLASDADADAGTPYGVARFTMQTIESSRVVEPEIQKLHIENVPYTFTQAAGHPWGLVTTIEFATEKTAGGQTVPTRDPRDIVVNLPHGLIGDPQAVPQCPLTLILANIGRCPSDTQIGVARVRWYGGEKESLAPIVNLTPEKGQSAEFGLETGSKITALLTAHVIRDSSGYSLTIVSKEIPITQLVEVETTFWGVPADPSHDAERGLVCQGIFHLSGCIGGNKSSGIAPIPFLTMPADCVDGPVETFASTDSWEEPGRFVTANALQPPVTGCDLLTFEPSIEVQPDTTLADSPVAVGVNLKVPQIETVGPPATPQLRDSVVTLPEGMSISPGIVDGIQACDESGPQGINFTGPESEETGLDGEQQLAPGKCPDASIIGTAEAETPLLASPVKGHIYLARPLCGGALPACTEQDVLEGKLYQLYLELGGTGELADTGVNLKVRGRVEPNPATGQLTTVFEGTPQLPFSELRIRLNGGPRASLDNPAVCGVATTSSRFTPWSAPGTTSEGVSLPGTPDATPSSYFHVEGCAQPVGLAPSLTAGMVTPDAGRFSSFTLNLSRKDREQYIKGIAIKTPSGLLGMLSNVPLCDTTDAETGHCPESSKIGTTRVASGAGSHPFEIEGAVYLTGSYEKSPFGLSIVTHVIAGPFDLGLVVVRARISIDQNTSTLTVTTDESGPHPIPQIVFGVPLRLQRVTVNIDRPRFMFNPTNCNAQHIEAKVSGSAGAVTEVSSPFAVGGCASLAFKPKFSASTSGRTSRAKGASLDVKLSYPAGSMGKEANVAKVKVSLPKRLPSRLTTLQQACPAHTFEGDPAACPKGSIVGIVHATTPVLPEKLSGPVYFVSHGGEAFPSLVVVLQGYGVRVDLTGTTFISKAGVTSSTFKTVPDVPVSNFELYLPESKTSALAANGNLCAARAKLIMPTTFIAQNGLQLKQNTKISVLGCSTKRGSKK